ncbi:hypothetical protein D3879_21890 [Pseudomonas cavernicola]|uniref:Uncharacterized protein n=1 Tax=Pseudomonas cavernicola TaxID=2320866 RepID=A0A418XA40_9PSED|nr:hypothetical protein D3879_21890 [Pseudomonas cavernicola]
MDSQDGCAGTTCLLHCSSVVISNTQQGDHASRADWGPCKIRCNQIVEAKAQNNGNEADGYGKATT